MLTQRHGQSFLGWQAADRARYHAERAADLSVSVIIHSWSTASRMLANIRLTAVTLFQQQLSWHTGYRTRVQTLCIAADQTPPLSFILT
jgi:hypothetical protein